MVAYEGQIAGQAIITHMDIMDAHVSDNALFPYGFGALKAQVDMLVDEHCNDCHDMECLICKRAAKMLGTIRGVRDVRDAREQVKHSGH